MKRINQIEPWINSREANYIKKVVKKTFLTEQYETKKFENKTPGVFFHAAFDYKAPGPRNTTQKSKNKEKLNF